MSSSSADDVVAVHRELHVAHLLGGVGRLGEAGLEREDPLGGVARGRHRCRRGCRAAWRCGPRRRRAAATESLVVADVVVALGQAEPALADVDEVGVGVLEVGRDAQRVERAHARRACRSRATSRTSATDSRRIDARRSNGSSGVDARRRDRGLVHRRGEVVADHPSGRTARPGRSSAAACSSRCSSSWLRSFTSWNAPHAPYSGGTGLASSQPPLTCR